MARARPLQLGKTVSGKIRHVELRRTEETRRTQERGDHEFWQEDFPELKKAAVESSAAV